MVFSKSFVQSQWCQFELDFCLSHVMDYDDALIVVCLDDVMDDEVTPSMMAVMKTTTYIQWKPHADVEAAFVGRLRQALYEVETLRPPHNVPLRRTENTTVTEIEEYV